MSFTNISLYTHINYMLATQTMSLQAKVIHMLISSEAVCVQVRLWQSHQSDWLLHFIYFLIIILYKLIHRVQIDLMIKHLAIDPTPKMHSVVPTDKFLKCLSILQLNGFHRYEVMTGWHQRPDYTSFHVQRICIIERHDPSTCTYIQTREGQWSSPSLDWQEKLWETTFTQLLPSPFQKQTSLVLFAPLRWCWSRQIHQRLEQAKFWLMSVV